MLLPDPVIFKGMTIKPAALVGSGLFLGMIGMYALGYHHGIKTRDAVSTQAVKVADQYHEVSKTEAARAEAYDEVAKAQDKTTKADEATVARLKSELSALRQHLADAATTTVGTDYRPAPDFDPVVGGLKELVAKQDETLKAQDRVTGDLRTQLETVTKARDSWKLSAQAAQAEAIQLRSALVARQGIEQAALWRGRLQGLAVGLSFGYLGGKK